MTSCAAQCCPAGSPAGFTTRVGMTDLRADDICHVAYGSHEVALTCKHMSSSCNIVSTCARALIVGLVWSPAAQCWSHGSTPIWLLVTTENYIAPRSIAGRPDGAAGIIHLRQQRPAAGRGRVSPLHHHHRQHDRGARAAADERRGATPRFQRDVADVGHAGNATPKPRLGVHVAAVCARLQLQMLRWSCHRQSARLVA